MLGFIGWDEWETRAQLVLTCGSVGLATGPVSSESHVMTKLVVPVSPVTTLTSSNCWTLGCGVSIQVIIQHSISGFEKRPVVVDHTHSRSFIHFIPADFQKQSVTRWQVHRCPSQVFMGEKIAGRSPLPILLSHVHVHACACACATTLKRLKAYNARAASRRRRPYLFDTLRSSLLTRVVADTLDWDVLLHYDFDATLLSLDTVYKGLNQDKETYYLLWIAVRKVLAEEAGATLTGDNVSGCIRYQKTRHLNELLDAVLEQFLAELGNALLEFVGGTHYTILDPRKYSDDPSVLVAKARSLVARFEKLGRDRRTIIVAIPATEAGIEAAASLQCVDGINVNLTYVSGVMHAAACAQAGAAAITLPVAAIRDWHRDRGGGVTCHEENTGEGSDEAIRDAQTIAAYFRQHDICSTQLLACNIDHTTGNTNGFCARMQVDDACSLAALDALSFDAHQARSAEWYNTYPNVPRTIPDSAVRRAASFFTPLPLDEDVHARTSTAKRTLRRMDAEALSTFSAVVCAALGSGRAAMSVIADIAKREIDWQLALLRPMYTVLRPAPQSAAAVATDKVVPPWTRDFSDRKRKRRAPEALLASGAYRCTVSKRSATPPPAGSRNEDVDDGHEDEEEEEEDAPTHHNNRGRLWRRLAIAEGRDSPQPSECMEDDSTAAVRHAVPEFGPFWFRSDSAPGFCRWKHNGWKPKYNASGIIMVLYTALGEKRCKDVLVPSHGHIGPKIMT
ncbi:hypothetical protein EI94DRAFT_1702315 [Lactarius quietus]|nr:hypothetical protein EI94DRAFT_1702315 [Lactarius quietus]